MTRPFEHAPAERWQHGHDREVDVAGREAVAKPVRALLRARRIGDAEVVAAERFYRAYFFGIEGASGEDREGPSGSPSPDAAMVARMDAAHDYSTATGALSSHHVCFLRWIVLEERNTPAGSGHARETWKQTAASALRALADHYAHKDRFPGRYENA